MSYDRAGGHVGKTPKPSPDPGNSRAITQKCWDTASSEAIGILPENAPFSKMNLPRKSHIYIEFYAKNTSVIREGINTICNQHEPVRNEREILKINVGKLRRLEEAGLKE